MLTERSANWKLLVKTSSCSNYGNCKASVKITGWYALSFCLKTPAVTCFTVLRFWHEQSFVPLLYSHFFELLMRPREWAEHNELNGIHEVMISRMDSRNPNITDSGRRLHWAQYLFNWLSDYGWKDGGVRKCLWIPKCKNFEENILAI
jgi:hypothetical protein